MAYNREIIFGELQKQSKKTFKVSDEYRTNPLSKQPGGSTVQVEYSDGSIRIYDKIKNVDAYTKFLYRSKKSEILDVLIL